MLFKLGGRPFQDVRVSEESWMEVKPTTPLGTLPFLEKDGQILGQSNAINRFLAKKFGLAGKSLWEEALADMVVDTVEEVWNGGVKLMYASEETKEEARQEYLEGVNKVLDKVEELLKKNNDGQGYFVGKGLTWADVAVYNDIEFANNISQGELWESRALLHAFKERFEMEARIVKHLASRPARPF